MPPTVRAPPHDEKDGIARCRPRTLCVSFLRHRVNSSRRPDDRTSAFPKTQKLRVEPRQFEPRQFEPCRFAPCRFELFCGVKTTKSPRPPWVSASNDVGASVGRTTIVNACVPGR